MLNRVILYIVRWGQFLINKALEKIGLKLIRLKSFNEILFTVSEYRNRIRVDKIICQIQNRVEFETYPKMHSQLGQEIFVLETLKYKKNGFFVEFGAAGGKNLSNTFTLEKEFDWRGICVEPGQNWRSELIDNRKCFLDFRCVYKISGQQINFSETLFPELSTIEQYKYADLHSEYRKGGKVYSVETISLNDLLLEYNAPQLIDYISIDTEGSEYEILSNFNFDKYNVVIFTIVLFFSV